jgi:hypothetical protein
MRVSPGKFIASIALGLIMIGCAQLGPPLPPSLELPKPPTDLRANRKGNRVTLTWSEPTLTTDRQSVRYLGPTNVCRSQKSEMSECGTPIATLPPPVALKPGHTGKQKTAKQQPTSQTYIDTLPAAVLQQNAEAEVTYAVEVLNRNNRSGGLSNRVQVSAIITLPPPSDLAADLTGDGVLLTWTGAESPNLPPNASANSANIQFRYRIYRRDEAAGKDAIAGEVPLSEPGRVHYTDSAFEWEKTYLYRVTVVSIVKRSDSEVQVEGNDSAPVRVIAHDVFPPSVPTGLQAAYSGEGQKPFIDLVWAPVTNADLAGYNIFRSETKSAGESSVEKMVKLNSEPVKSPSYRDFAVVAGKTYTYSVSAVDVRGNESQRSETTNEVVP